MARRIYLGREVSKYAEIAGGAIVTVTSLFFVLMFMGLEITGSDDVCQGTPEDPCVSYGKICNVGPNNYDIYNPDEVKMDFSPTVKNSWMFFKDGRVKKNYFKDKGINFDSAGWRYENFTNETKSRSDVLYVHRFARYSCQEYMLVGLKNNPDDLIKWGVGVGGEYLDPFWYGVNDSAATTLVSGNISVELGTPINITTNLTGASTVCVDIDHPEFGTNYTCGTPNANFTLNISYFRKTELNDTNTTQNFTYAAEGNETIYIRGHQYDELINLSFNLTGDLSGGSYPENVKIYVNGSLSNSIGPLRPSGATTTLQAFSDTSVQTSSEDYYIDAGATEIKYLRLPKDANITYASFNYTGLTDWTGDSFYGQVADGESNNCTEEDCGDSEGFPADDQPKAYDSDNSTYSYSYSCGSDTGEFSDFKLNYTHNVSNAAKFNWNILWDFDAYDNSAYRRQYTSQCWDYDTGAWSTIETIMLLGGSPTYEKFWERSYTITNENYLGCFKGSNIQLRAYFLKIGSGAFCSTIRVYELDTQSSTGRGVSWWNATDFPQNLTIEVGAVDGTWEGNQSGQIDINDSFQTDDFNDTINTWLSTCTADSDGYCEIPVYFTSDGEGKFKVHNIVINYTYDPNPIFLNKNLINNFLNSSSGFADIPITLYSNTTGITRLTDIKYDYLGGNDTIELKTYSIGQPCYQESFNISNQTGTDGLCTMYYNGTTSWAGDYDMESVVDGNWSTGIACGTYSFGTCTKYMNYTKPDNARSTSTWEISDNGGGSGATFRQNFSIPDSCWAQPILQFYVHSYISNGGNVGWYCYNSTSWVEIRLYDTPFPPGGSWSTAYEEAMHWDMEETINVFTYYSDFFKNLPYTWTTKIFFIPKTNSSKNVTAYGQTSTTPIYNITTTNYGGMNLNLLIKVNETFSCLNLTWNATGNTKPSNQIINTTYQSIATNLEYLNNTQIWMWADFNNCNASNQKLMRPEIFLKSYCVECV